MARPELYRPPGDEPVNFTCASCDGSGRIPLEECCACPACGGHGYRTDQTIGRDLEDVLRFARTPAEFLRRCQLQASAIAEAEQALRRGGCGRDADLAAVESGLLRLVARALGQVLAQPTPPQPGKFARTFYHWLGLGGRA